MLKLLEKRVSDAMIVEMARVSFEEERAHAEIAEIMGISPAYVQKLLADGARRNLYSVSRRKVTSNIDGQAEGAALALSSPSQLTVVVDGTRVVIAVEMSSVEPQTTRMEMCGRTITVTVARSNDHSPA